MKKLVVIGDSIDKSLSPIMHNTALVSLGLNNDYQYGKINLNNDELVTFVELIRKGDIFGANVTFPHKIAIKDYMDELTKEAKLIGAVNTIYKCDKKIIGHNTDGIGCLNSFKDESIDITGKKIMILGAGGASRAIAFTFALNNVAKIYIVNRSIEKAIKLADDVKQKTNIVITGHNIKEINYLIKDCDILINTTIVGMKGDFINQTIVDKNDLHSNLIVMDIIYNPSKTKLLYDAEKKGCKIINGLGMLVNQGAESFKIWTNKNPPLEVMKKAVEGMLK
jgi:shikimate dehydrogenase